MSSVRLTAMILALVLQSVAYGSNEKNCDVVLTSTQARQEARQNRKAAFASRLAFKDYFTDLKGRLFERDYVLELAQLALLSEEHVLLMGPPGNAKSLLADSILGNIKTVDGKKSYYRIQMTPETTQSETHGPLDFKTLNETGQYVRILEEGMLYSRNVFIDEIFDARANALRNILGLLNERSHAQGVHITKGSIETAFAATNKYISEVYEKAGDEGPKAVIDRFAFGAFVPGEFLDTSSYVTLIQGAKKSGPAAAEITFDDIENLRTLVPQVEIPEGVAKFLSLLSTKMKDETESLEQSSIRNYKERLKNGEDPGVPYRATKYHSPRTLGKAAAVLKAIVVLDWIEKDGKRRLTANLDDVFKLEKFFTLNGPSNEFINQIVERTSNPHERAQLMAILQEREIFEKYYYLLLDEANQVLIHFALHDLQAEVGAAKTKAEKEEVRKKIISLYIALEGEVDSLAAHSAKTGRHIGIDLVREEYKKLIAQTLGASESAQAIVDRIEEQRKAIAIERINQQKAAEEKILRAERLEKARIAAQLAQEAEQKRRLEQAQAKVLASLQGRKSVATGTLNSGSVESVTYAFHETSEVLAIFEKGSTDLVLVQTGANPKELLKLGLNADVFSNFSLSSLQFIDAEHILFQDSEGISGIILNLKTKATEEILLSRTAGSMLLSPKRQAVFSVDTKGVLNQINLVTKARTGKPLTFVTTELAEQFESHAKDSQVYATALSSDEKYITFLGYEARYEFVIEVDKNEVISSREVLEANSSVTSAGFGTVAYVDNRALVVDNTIGPAKFELLPENDDLTHSSQYYRYGVYKIQGTNFSLVGTQPDLKLFNAETGELTPIAIEGLKNSYVALPLLLPNGNLVVFEYDDEWKWHIAK